MKISKYLALGMLVLCLTPVWGQEVQTFDPTTGGLPVKPAKSDNLTKFNLDFPGGTPKELVAAIEKATGKPLNVIIPNEGADTKLPPVKVSDMNVVKLFRTLSENGRKYLPGNDGVLLSNCGFKTIDTNPSDSSLWTFYSYTRPISETRFSIDFPGGTPAQLVKAIEKAMGKPLNAIIPTDDADLQIPPLKMNDVFVPNLFYALASASHKTTVISNGPGNGYSSYTGDYGFRTQDSSPTDTSVWYFFVNKPAVPPTDPFPKICRFYPLSAYLDHGFTVDDITTAIQTGWKMAGITSTPELNYHKETKLLIAFGEPDKLKTIDDVLKALEPPKPFTFGELMDQNAANELKRAMQFRESVNSTNSLPAEKSGK